MTDEHTIAIVSFEGAVKRQMKKVREALRGADEGTEFHFGVACSGRIQEGDVKIAYTLGASSYDDKKVTGSAPDPVVEEYLRRMGWKKQHEPKAIGYDEIPF
ncbi:MAG: hypothetical protein ACE5HV_00060 [Acidobacteriota bacterium]